MLLGRFTVIRPIVSHSIVSTFRPFTTLSTVSTIQRLSTVTSCSNIVLPSSQLLLFNRQWNISRCFSTETTIDGSNASASTSTAAKSTDTATNSTNSTNSGDKRTIASAVEYSSFYTDDGLRYGNKAMSRWLLICAAAVFGMVVLGGLTRLTKSGLSMVEWKPTSITPPMNHSEWLEEFEKYKQFPEYSKVNHQMTLQEFKFIYFMEFTHRLM